MKILMTGMAARGIGSTRTRYKITSLPDAYAKALRSLGHEVDGPRRVRLDEDLSGYDAAFVQLGWTSSLSSSYAHEAGRVLAHFDETHSSVRYIDDWRSQWLADDIHGHVLSDKGWTRHTKKFRAKEYGPLSMVTRDRIRAALARPVTEDGYPLIIPIMGWGDLDLFDVSRNAKLKGMQRLDPQSFCIAEDTQPLPDEQREKQWVIASLQEHDKWVASLDLTWDVLRLGGVKKNPGGTVIKDKSQPVIPESEVCQIYAENWGVLSPEYLSSGSGYWRTRWAQTADAGAILWPGLKDAIAAGPSYVAAQPQAVENMTTSELVDLRDWQAEELDKSMEPVDYALAVLDNVFETLWEVER